MTVAELIFRLTTLPQDANVFIEGYKLADQPALVHVVERDGAFLSSVDAGEAGTEAVLLPAFVPLPNIAD